MHFDLVKVRSLSDVKSAPHFEVEGLLEGDG